MMIIRKIKCVVPALASFLQRNKLTALNYRCSLMDVFDDTGVFQARVKTLFSR